MIAQWSLPWHCGSQFYLRENLAAATTLCVLDGRACGYPGENQTFGGVVDDDDPWGKAASGTTRGSPA